MPQPRPDPDDDGPSTEDVERFSGATRECPNCGTELYDDAAVCWSCGFAVEERRRAVPTWVMIVVTLLIVATGLALIL